ncbi:F-box protein SKIP23-like [Andrographis paniculata]|uniref:F-box protein SKIP23-like n=1 Tax=Andrographis paniculata TaxID=175694 RepID=UPI0021E9395F|nr:F-box protein SKIP23-like [Andrographis paniculata]
MSNGVDWADLPPELLQTVATRLPTLADYIRFRVVCKNWRASALVSRFYLPREFPWLMLPLSRSSGGRRFFNPLTKNLHRLTLPEASHGRRRAGSSHGWLVLIDESPSIFIINPLTRDRISLPPLSSFPNVMKFDFYSIGREYTLRSPENDLYYYNLRQMRDAFIKKVILSHSPYEGSKFIALALLNRHENLAYCENGHGPWKIIDEARSFIEDAIYFNSSFYAVNKFGSLAICDLYGASPKVKFINVGQQIGGDMQYLVNAMGDLLLVSRYLEFEIDIEHYLEVCKTVKFHVLRFEWNEQRWESIDNLGDKLLFLGANSSMAQLASDHPGCTGNRIYFTDDYSGANYESITDDHDVGVYNLEDGSIETIPCYPRNSHWPIWMTPSLC